MFTACIFLLWSPCQIGPIREVFETVGICGMRKDGRDFKGDASSREEFFFLCHPCFFPLSSIEFLVSPLRITSETQGCDESTRSSMHKLSDTVCCA